MIAPRALNYASFVVLATAALAGGWLESRRPQPSEAGDAGRTFEVVSGEDAGLGSLREALFAVAAGDGPARVVIHSRVRLASPLPPVVHTAGLVIEGRGLARINASGLTSGPVFDLRSPDTLVRGLRIESADVALRVRAAGVELHDIAVTDCDQGVTVDPTARGFTLADSTFADNRIGVQLPADPQGMQLVDNHFSGHSEAAARATAAEPAPAAGPPLKVTGNHFDADQVALVLANVAALVENNEVADAREAGIYLLGAGAVVRGNRLRGGTRHGIVVLNGRDAEVTGNELDRHAGVAVLVSGGTGTHIENNQVRRNGFGIATFFGTAEAPVVIADNTLEGQRYDGLYVVGGSPWLRGNRSTGGGGAGLQLLSYLPLRGGRLDASPHLDDNEFEGNRLGSVVRGDYRERR